MSEQRSEIDRSVADVLRRMGASSATVPDLRLDAATPLTTLPSDLVAIIVGRVQAGATAFGDDHPRAAITKRVVVPCAGLAVLDAAGLVVAASTGHGVLATVAAVLLVVLAYLTFAGVRFVRTDPLRVTPEQREYVDAAKIWTSQQAWTDELRGGPWARLVVVAVDAAGRVAASDAWTWASIAGQRAENELGPMLDRLDAAALTLAARHEPVPASGASGHELVRRVAALGCYADALDDLVRRAVRRDDVRDELPDGEDERLGAMLVVARVARDGEPS